MTALIETDGVEEHRTEARFRERVEDIDLLVGNQCRGPSGEHQSLSS